MARTPARQKSATVGLILGNPILAKIAGPIFIYVVRQYVSYRRLYDVYVKHRRLRIYRQSVYFGKRFHRVADRLQMTPKLVVEIGDILLYLFYTRRLLETFNLEPSQLEPLKPLAIALHHEDVELILEVAKMTAFKLRFWEQYKYLVRMAWEPHDLESSSLKLAYFLEMLRASLKREQKTVKTRWIF